MPGRVSTRNVATVSAAQKAPSQPLRSRRTTASSNVAIPDEGPSSSLRTRVCLIFGDAQKSTAAHRKLAVNLRKIQEECCYEPTSRRGQDDDDFGEDDFNVEIARCVIRLMGVKKSEGAGDRIVRFLGMFLRRANDKDAALMPEVDIEDPQTFPETPSTRLTSHILSILLPLLASKEKVVRYRATQLVAHIINSLDSVDDDSYHLIRVGLLKRVRDKEPMIRVQAVLGLGRLAGNEGEEDQDDADSDNDDASGLLDKLLEVLQNDPSAEVRRALLLNLPLAPKTLPFLLERARDVDSVTRRALYSRLLPALGDFRHLSLSMREKLLRWGLRDRDENVRKETGKLFRERWIEDCVGSTGVAEDGTTQQAVPPSLDGLLELLERIDVVNSAASNGIATEAMRDFWSGRPDYRDAISFNDPFWDHLTPESVFVARSFNDFCKGGEDGKFEALAEEKMPEVTKLAFFVQRYVNDLVSCIRYNSALGEGEPEEDTVEKEFIVEQLLRIAEALDYSDEIGRRKMFALLRETLAIAELPEEITMLVVNVLRRICGSEAAGEREFCGVVLEAVAEVHDHVMTDDLPAENEDESFHSARSELSDSTPTKARLEARASRDGDNSEMDEDKAIREIMINMKCLHIAQCMLENVEGDLQQNIHLVTMLNNLVVPAVRSHEAPIRERGLLCLGLCCLLDKALAEENLSLFLHCFSKGHDALQVSALYILSDILTVHSHLVTADNVDPGLQKSVYKIFGKGLKASTTAEVQSAATSALCKLMLTSVIRDEDLLKQLVTLFFDPAAKENAAVTQALSYFLPVFCHSRWENMEMMAAVAANVVHHQVNLADEMDEEDGAIGVNMIGNMLVDWTDARKLVVQDGGSIGWDEAGGKDARAVNGDIHLTLAESLLERALAHGCSKDERKVLLSMMGKVYITSNSSAEKLQAVSDLVAEAIDGKLATDTATKNALNKCHLALSKALGEARTAQSNMEDQRVDPTMIESETRLEVETQVDENEVQVDDEKAAGTGGARDSLLEEPLDDENEDEDEDI
ncbi:MAG: hypothetical protein L6R38_002555 [Xanthoria sp. 2 TBL-2021]|nr:MAG: hypothetical protein L6R38_002555 [Xanthoria sp. 2 TBL-2021]